MPIDFDVIFLDVTSKKYYDRQVLERQALGGTEASVVRVAEGLAGFGLRVAVVQSQVPFFDPVMGQHCFFMHSDALKDMTCKHLVQIRHVHNSQLFPKAKKYVWCHDEADEGLKTWNAIISKDKVKVIGVSKWHKKDIEKYILSSNIEYIYNPVPDEIYNNLEVNYIPDNFVWAASPHKGLGKCIEVFKKIKERLPKANLIVAHPGYMNVDLIALQNVPGVSVCGPIPSKSLWNVIQSSLCVLYPSDYNETFCCILAESNALGTPFLGYNRQVLKEVVSSNDQLVEDGNEDAIIDRAVEWNTNGRPKIEGQDQFKLSNIIFKWIQTLAN